MRSAIPRIAVIGSCVTRDPFNRIFSPDYKLHTELVSSIFQSSFPSFVREEEISRDIPEGSTERYKNLLRREYLGKNMAEIILSKPDVIVIDFYADVHFGITKINGQYVTRNHMAFENYSNANNYYDDTATDFPNRGRFEVAYKNTEYAYQQLVIESLAKFNERLRSKSPNTKVVINSARFATAYQSGDNKNKAFVNITRLVQKNRNWQALDEIAQNIIGDYNISYPEELLVGTKSHKWGLNPVHYGRAYYDHFWKEIKIINKD